MDENQRVFEALERLSASLADLPDKQSPPKLSHWRTLPEPVETAYTFMTDGAELVKATATKYTLVTKINVEEGSKIAQDLLKGSELVATGALVLCEDHTGCSRSARHYSKQAARAVISSTLELVKAFLSESTLEQGNQLGAQKTGAVWSTCDAILKVPKGNRASMRRDVLMWTMECNETLQEFTQMLELGACVDNHGVEEATWDDFLAGDDEQYTAKELPIATASVAMIKCSRGSMNVTLKTCEAVGTTYEESDKEGFLEWIAMLHNLARGVGEGMTDLGACLYPPLELIVDNGEGEEQEQHLVKQLTEQRDAIVALHDFVLDANAKGVESLDLPEEVTELAAKLRTAAQARYEEAQKAISAAMETVPTR